MGKKIAWFLAVVVLSVGCQVEGAGPAATAVAESPVTPVAGKTVDDVLAAYVAARGGKDKLAAVQTVRMSGTLSGGGLNGFPLTIEKKRPTKYHRVLEDPEGRQVTVFDGTTGWQKAGPGEARQLPAPAVPRLHQAADIDGPLVDPKGKGYKAELLGKQKIDGGEAYVVKLTPDNGPAATYFIDTKTNLLTKSRETVPTSSGMKEAELSYTDYRPVNGVLWPFKQTSVAGERKVTQTSTWSKIEVNPALDDSLFVAPK
jgi:outer membrane lipoprotein-sorting protein